MNFNKKWFVGLVGLVLVLVSIWLFNSLKQDQLSRRIQQKQVQAESANHEFRPAQVQEINGKSSTRAKKEGEQTDESFRQSTGEHSPLDAKEKEIKPVPSLTPSDEGEPKESAEVQAIRARIKTLETQIQGYKQQIDALSRQTGEISELNEANRVRVRELEALRGNGREISPEENMRILNEIRSRWREIEQREEMNDQITVRMRPLGLKFMNTREELDLLRDSLKQAGN